MNDPEIIKLKKKIHNLTEHNVQLQQQVEDLSLQIGEYQLRNLELTNQGLVLQTQKELATDEEKIKKQLEKVMADEREETIKFKKENESLKEQIKAYERQIKDDEIYIQKLQLNNEKLQKDLIEFGKKHEAQDYIEQIKQREQHIKKADEQKEQYARDYNELCDKMEDVIAENRVLRQIADVPENFGIDISKINIGDRVKIEDYKAKIRILQYDIDNLESERAQLKHNLYFLANTLSINEPHFSLLTPEQKVEVARYAQNLYEGKESSQPEKYDLMGRLREKDNQIKILEEELERIKKDGRYIGPSGQSSLRNQNNINNNDQLKSMKKMLEDYKNDIIKTIGEKRGDYLGGDGQNIPMNSGVSFYNMGNNTGMFDILSVNQLPPVPLYNNSNLNNTNEASSYRFNCRFKIQPNVIHEIFGVAENGEDPEALKRESFALQCQIIELLEIESRRNNNDENLKKNLDNIYNKLEKITLIQNEIFRRYMDKNMNNESEIKNFKTQINNLNDELLLAQKKNKSYEERLNILERKDTSEINKKILEKMKENAILDGNYIKLNRKYKSLVEEERSLREFMEVTEKNNLEKEKQLKETITKLKKWKTTLTKYLKFVTEKLRNSVDRDEYDKINMDNRFLREKNNMLTLREIAFTKESTLNQTLILKYKDLEDSFYLMEEGKYDAEIEMNYLKHRLQEMDPNYYNEQRAFRKLLSRLSSLNMTYSQIRNVFLSVNSSVPSLYSDYKSSTENKNANNNLFNDLSYLKGLTVDNSFITKSEFEMCLKKLGINEDDINSTDLILIYRVLNCGEDNMVDIRYFLKKIEQNSIVDLAPEENENKVLEDFIKCVQQRRQNLLLIFEHFDTNNNGCITREEFKYALSQLGFSIDDENITKLIFLVTGDTAVDKDVNIQNLDSTDTFHYIEFCNLFEQKSKNYLLKQKRQYLNKNKMQIDWKTNALTKIYLSMNKNHLLIDDAFLNRDKTEKGYLTFNEFDLFLDSINALLNSEKKRLFDYFDTEKSGYISIDTLKKALHQVLLQSEEYQKLNSSSAISYNQSLASEKDIKNKYFRLIEEKKFFEIKINNLQKKCDGLEQSNNSLSKEIVNYKNQNMENVDKYLEVQRELQDLREEFQGAGVKRSDFIEVQNENDSLRREVMLLRVGMNTFKELYNATNMQVKHLNINEKKNLDELDMYKRALKELQGESNQNSLIGKLYYTVLVSRWREAQTLRNYGDLINDFGSLKEENFVLEKDNKLLIENLNDINKTLHKEIIEKLKIMDQMENLENGINEGNFNQKGRTNPLDEMKKLVNMLKDDKKENTEKLIMLKKKVLSLENAKNSLESKIDFCENLKNNIKFNNRDEFSKKLINLSEELSNVKLQNNILTRENNFERENAEHLQRLNDQLNESLKSYEIQTADLENKYTKMEELFRKKDEERQNKILAALERMKLYDSREINNVLNSKPLFGDKNISNVRSLSNLNNPRLAQLDAVNEEKINQLNRMIDMKDQEIQRLMKLNEENAKFIREGEGFLRNNANLLMENKDDNNNDETKLVAHIAQKTIASIQYMLNEKTRQLNQKNKQIEDLYDEIAKLKTENIQRVNSLEDQIKDAHETNIGKLSQFIDNTNRNLIAKFTRKDLEVMTLNDLEKLINDKDNALTMLANELKAVKEENDTNYVLLKEKNRTIEELKIQMKILKENTNEEYNKNIIIKLQKDIDMKTKEIEEERKKANEMKNNFEKIYKKKLLEEEEAKLANTVFVPERLIVNKEKSELYVKIEKLRKENRKLKDEKKKLMEEKEELKKKYEDIDSELKKQKDKNNQGLQIQSKETNNLRKEKERLKKKNKELTDKIELLNQKISTLEHQIINQPQPQNNAGYQSRPLRRRESSKRQSYNKPEVGKEGYSSLDIYEKIKKQDEDKLQTMMKSGEKFLLDFVHFCMAKKIDIKNHLRSYDTSKNGRLTDENFMKAIIELKTSFTENDIREIIKISKPKDGGDIIIDEFIELMKKKDYSFKVKDDVEINNDNKQASKKYDLFANKPYNIDYP